MNLPFNACLKQGGMDSPYGWNLIMAYIFAPLHEAWIKAGYGIRLDEYTTLTHVIWSDNLFLFATSKMHLSSMFSSLTSSLTYNKLFWKHDSLWMLRSGYIKEREHESDSSTSDDDELILTEDTGLNVGVDGVDYAIPSVRSTTILGNEVYNHGFEFDVVETQLRKPLEHFMPMSLSCAAGTSACVQDSNSSTNMSLQLLSMAQKLGYGAKDSTKFSTLGKTTNSAL